MKKTKKMDPSNKFVWVPPKIEWSDYKTKIGEHDTQSRHFRIGEVQIYVNNDALGWPYPKPRRNFWYVTIYAYNGPRVIETDKLGGTLSYTDTKVSFLPLTATRFKTRKTAMSAAEKVFQQLSRFVTDMVSVDTTKKLRYHPPIKGLSDA